MRVVHLLGVMMILGVGSVVLAQNEAPLSVTLGNASLKVGDVIVSHANHSKLTELVVSSAGKELQTVPQGEMREDKREVTVLAANEAGDATSIRVTFKTYNVKVIQKGQPVDVPSALSGNTYLVQIVDGKLDVRSAGTLPIDPKVKQEVEKAFSTDVGPVLVQRKLGKLLGGKTFKVGETTAFTGEQVRKHMGLPEAFEVKAMKLFLRSIKKASLLNPRAAEFELSLTLVGKTPPEKKAQGLNATEELQMSGTVLLSVATGRVLAVTLDGTTTMTGTLQQPNQLLDLRSSGNLKQKQLLVYSRQKALK